MEWGQSGDALGIATGMQTTRPCFRENRHDPRSELPRPSLGRAACRRPGYQRCWPNAPLPISRTPKSGSRDLHRSTPRQSPSPHLSPPRGSSAARHLSSGCCYTRLGCSVRYSTRVRHASSSGDKCISNRSHRLGSVKLILLANRPLAVNLLCAFLTAVLMSRLARSSTWLFQGRTYPFLRPEVPRIAPSDRFGRG
jgi:hypothetical protein